MNILTTIVIVGLALTAVYLLIDGVLGTGPNCPDMDPAWLGRCAAPALE